MKTSTFLFLVAAASTIIVVLSPPLKADEKIEEAVAMIRPVKGQQVTGTMRLVPAGNGLKITGELFNLEPGVHGFHVHRYGDCSSPNSGSVGPHFAPRTEGEGYYGDLPQVEAGPDGAANYDAEVGTLAFGGEYSVIGRALVVHALNGDKIGCGVIGIAK